MLFFIFYFFVTVVNVMQYMSSHDFIFIFIFCKLSNFGMENNLMM
jgi:hypothetical protein